MAVACLIPPRIGPALAVRTPSLKPLSDATIRPSTSLDNPCEVEKSILGVGPSALMKRASPRIPTPRSGGQLFPLLPAVLVEAEPTDAEGEYVWGAPANGVSPVSALSETLHRINLTPDLSLVQSGGEIQNGLGPEGEQEEL